MKKIALLLCAIVLLTGCNKTADEEEYSVPGLSLPKTGSYFCPQKGYDNKYTLNEDVFDAAEKCAAWKSDFWKDAAPHAYQECLDRKKLFAERFQKETCTPILKKTYNKGKSGCIFEVAMKYDKIIKYSCYGEDIPRVIQEIKQKYEHKVYD